MNFRFQGTHVAVLAAALRCWPWAPVATAATPMGPEFLVNSYTTNAQGGPRVATDPQGNFVIVWESGYGAYGPGLDGSQMGISAQRFNSTGSRLGSELLVNSYTTADQSGPALAMAPDGSFVVSWSGCCSDGRFRTFAQRFDGLGNRLGTEFPVESTNLGGGATIAIGDDGGFLVAWGSFIESQNAGDIFGRAFDREGVPVTSDLLVNSYTTGDQTFPHVLATRDESFLVVWSDAPQGILQFDAQRFTAAGDRSGGPFILQRNPDSQNDFGGGRFTLDADGNFVGTWQRFLIVPDLGLQEKVVAQRFAENGSSLGSTFFVNPVAIRTPILQQRQPTLAAAPAGGFVIAWTQLFTYIGPPERALRQGDPNSPGIVARCFDRSGHPLGPAFRVDSVDDDGDDSPSIAVMPSGHIVFTWTLGGDVHARIFHEPAFAPGSASTGAPAWPVAMLTTLVFLATAARAVKHRRTRPARGVAHDDHAHRRTRRVFMSSSRSSASK